MVTEIAFYHLERSNLEGALAKLLEKALEGVSVQDDAQPVEVLRVVHSFDPCLACAVHMVDTRKQELIRVQAVGAQSGVSF